MDGIVFLNKWIHLLSIIGVLGGTSFAWIVLAPASRGEAADGTMAPLWKRFGIAVGVLWLIVLATGFMNFYIVTPKVNGSYQMYLGMKMALAILMFILTLLVAHPMPAMARFFQSKGGWLLLLTLLGVVIVGISAHLNISRINGTGLKAAPSVAAAAPSP